MKILFIKQLFYPEPTARGLDFAKQLLKLGHEVQVVTGFPSYPKGEIYEGYSQKMFYRENIEGVEIIRVPIFPNQGSKPLGRIINYLSYSFSSIFFGLFRSFKPDMIFVYHGALTVSIPALIFKIFKGAPVVYDINDLWPDTLSATKMVTSSIPLRIVSIWSKLTYKFVDHITVLSEGFKKKLIERGVKESKITVINHWSRDNEIIENKSIAKSNNLLDPNKFNLLYAGNVGLAQSLNTLILACEDLYNSYPNLVLTILGDGVEKDSLKQLVRSRNINNVVFLNRVSSDEVGKYLHEADVLLVHLKDDPIFRITIPSKIISYLFAGKPILLGVEGDAKEIITKSNCGRIFIPDNSVDFKSKLIEFMEMEKNVLSELGENAKFYYSKNFTIHSGVAKYMELFQELNSKHNL